MDKLRIVVKVTDDISPGYDVYAVILDDRESMTRVNFGDPQAAVDYLSRLLVDKETYRKAATRSTRRAAKKRPLSKQATAILALLSVDTPTKSIEISNLLKVPNKGIAANLNHLESKKLVRCDRSAAPPYLWFKTPGV